MRDSTASYLLVPDVASTCGQVVQSVSSTCSRQLLQDIIKMLILPPQQAVIDSLRTSLAAHLEPDIHIPSLVRLLDLLAHTALLADKLATEIDRIRRHPGFRLEAKDKISLVGLKATAEEAGRTLWEETLRLRELVRS